MREPEEFDAFYKTARTRLLLQTYALTGDLAASRAAVRESFVVTWHHWRKVHRLSDPESWVRPRAWARAQRRHTARLWRRDRHLDPEVAATLDALGKLTLTQRKALLLETLTSLSVADRARELGLTRPEAERQTRTASARFSVHRDVAATDFPRLLQELHARVEDTPWPRGSILRRSGAARRRSHTLVGAVAGLATVLGTGVLVDGGTPARTRLPSAEGDAASPAVEPQPERPQFAADALLDEGQVQRVVDGPAWRATGTSDNTEGDGLATPCQQRRYADVRARAALRRDFATRERRGRPARSAVQTAELSGSVRSAVRTWDQALGWYAGCTAPQVQLQATSRVDGVGDRAMLLQLRDWRRRATYLVGVARTGQITTTTFLSAAAGADPDPAGATRLLARAVDGLCPTPQGGRCAEGARTRGVAPVAVGEVPGLLAGVDLPRVPGVGRPWVGTEPREARANVAATTCDRTDFAARPVRRNVTRTFLVPQARLPATFGVTQTAGTLPTPARARAFVGTIRRELASCPDRDLGADVSALASSTGRDREHAAWRVTVELNDRETATYLMGVVRRGSAVSQLGFVPGAEASIGSQPFRQLLLRAGERLPYLQR